MPVVGYLSTGSPGPLAPNAAAFRLGLSEAGYIEGQNVAIEYRWAEDHDDRLPALAADLVDRKVSIIMTVAAARRWRRKRLPRRSRSCSLGVNDPVGLGLVANFAQPGGNLTGFSNILAAQLTPKRLDLLLELVPHAKIIALLVDPDNPGITAP